MKTIIRKAKRNPDGSVDQIAINQSLIRCPRCGEWVQRPGNAETHGCFRFSQDELQRIQAQMVFHWIGKKTRPKTELGELAPVDMRRF